MKLFYNHNIATHKLGLVLCNTTIENNDKKLPWKNATQNATSAANVMKTIFGCTDVVTVTDGSKAEIAAAYDKL